MKKATLLSLVLLLGFCVTAKAQGLPSLRFSDAPEIKVTVTPQTGSGHSVVLNWTQSVGVGSGGTCTGTGNPATITANTVYRSTTTGTEVLLATIPAGTTYTDAGALASFPLVPGATYFYKVSASNCNGPGALSNEASATIPNPLTPAAPTGLGVTSVASDLSANPKIYAMTLGWTAPAKYTNGQPMTGQVYFNVYRDIAGTEKYSKINASPVIGTAYFDDGLKGGTTYNYQVTAWQLSSDRESPFSNKAGQTVAK